MALSKMRGIHIVLITLALTASSLRAYAADDELGRVWLARSELASKHLSHPGNDACDIALDRAFAHPREINTRVFRTFNLLVELGGQTLQVSYSYRGGQLASFELVALPPKWIARQRTNSKTLSVLVASANCAMDFCTSNPLAPGACAGDTPE